MPDLSPDTLVEIKEFGDELIEKFTPPEFVPGCTVKDISDINEYDTDNGWIECIVREHNQQRCRWRGQVPGIQVNDIVDVMYFKSYRLFVVFGQGGVAASTNILNNYAGTAAPGAGDDTNDGYSVGSEWVDTTNDNTYKATDVTAGSANWEQTNGGGGGGDFVEIASYHLTSGTNVNVDFTSIPATYTHLELRGNVRIDGLGLSCTINLRFNNDSGSNYDYMLEEMDGSGTSTISETSGGRQTSALIGRGNCGLATANTPSPFRMFVPNYARTDQNKTCTIWTSASGADSANTHFEQLRGDAWWHSTSAINRITLVATVAADTHLTLYGLNST